MTKSKLHLMNGSTITFTDTGGKSRWEGHRGIWFNEPDGETEFISERFMGAYKAFTERLKNTTEEQS